MPLHMSGLVSRGGLTRKSEVSPEPVAYERILKFNPNHDNTGRFSSGGGGGKGGVSIPRGTHTPEQLAAVGSKYTPAEQQDILDYDAAFSKVKGNRVKELDLMEHGYERQLNETGLKKHVAAQIRDSLGRIRRERTRLLRKQHAG